MRTLICVLFLLACTGCTSITVTWGPNPGIRIGGAEPWVHGAICSKFVEAGLYADPLGNPSTGSGVGKIGIGVRSGCIWSIPFKPAPDRDLGMVQHESVADLWFAGKGEDHMASGNIPWYEDAKKPEKP